jgi:hypothetical protein
VDLRDSWQIADGEQAQWQHRDARVARTEHTQDQMTTRDQYSHAGQPDQQR